MNSRIASILAVISISNTAAAAADLLPIDRGYYVESNTACDNASNATITLYNGSSFGSAHAECRKPVMRRLADGSYQTTEKCRDMQGRGGPWATLVTTYVVLSRTEFTLTNPYGKFHYRYCRQSEMPEPWSKNDISSLGH